MKWVRKELAFRMGSTYCEVVKWCLTFADQPAEENSGDDWHPALQFYNNVVLPLDGISNAEATE